MIKLFKRKNTSPSPPPQTIDEANTTLDKTDQKALENAPQENCAPPQDKKGFFKRISQGLTRTKHHFTQGISQVIFGKKAIDAELLEALENQLLIADVGIQATEAIMTDLTAKVARKQLADGQALMAALQQHLQQILVPVSVPFKVDDDQQPYVILMVGVNGSGKTTTIGKLAKNLQNQGKKVLLAAGDTFRAAAVEQLQVWGERNHIPVIAQKAGADPASVIYDAFAAAKARHCDVLIADTAGRLHTQHNLMAELKKVKRVMGKLEATAPHEVMLVLDAGIGQNALVQAEQFCQAIDVNSITMTKLDGTAKGGIIFAIAKKLALPIRFIGVGEAIDDLRPFHGEEFVAALFDGVDK